MSGIAYAVLDSPIGDLLVASTRQGLVRIGLPAEDPGAVLDELASRLSLELAESPRRVAAPRRELDEYFAGTRRRFTLPLDWAEARGFRRRALEAMSRLPFGETVTYKELATRAGNPRAARAAGHACATNPIPIVVPCHRVIGSDGSLHGYTGGLQVKEFLLELEGAR
jgi:methylated-DNA-[protein]-cysteine S-methyltransferase